jgi:hypothetical protein
MGQHTSAYCHESRKIDAIFRPAGEQAGCRSLPDKKLEWKGIFRSEATGNEVIYYWLANFTPDLFVKFVNAGS